MSIAALLATAMLVQGPADLVVVNARIWTDGKLTPHRCLAVKNGRFSYLGVPKPQLIGPRTKRIDAGGKVVVPGLIDSHTHLMEGGVGLFELELRPAQSKVEFISLIKNWSDKLPISSWVVGNGWSAESWPEKETPTKEWLDAVTGGRPAILYRMDGHSAIANSEALKRAGITKDKPVDPPGGVIDRDPVTKEPTGMLRESAVGLVLPPAPTAEDRYRGFERAVALANRWGITAVSDISSTGYASLYRRFASGAPTLRVSLYARTSSWPTAIRSVKGIAPVPGWFAARGLKAYMDGSLGSRTAFMAAPFDQRLPGQSETWRGLPMPGATDGTYATGVQLAAEAGLQVIIHAIGDQANHDVLAMYSGVPNIIKRRYRVEHAQHLLRTDIPTFARLGVIPSLQPYHKVDDGRYCDDVIGKGRSETSYAFRDLFRTGAKVAFGSDWDVVPLNPFWGIAAAVTGRLDSGRIWVPQQNISVDQALTAYTTNAAYSMFMEDAIGRIRPGYHADFVILDRSPFDKGTDLTKIEPVATYVEGRVAYEAKSGK